MRWPEKRWQYVAVAGDELFLAVAIADLGYLGVAFAYAFDRQSGAVHEYGTKTPFALGVTVGREPDEPSRLALPGMRIDHDPAGGSLSVRSRAFAADLRVSRSESWDATWVDPHSGDAPDEEGHGRRGRGAGAAGRAHA